MKNTVSNEEKQQTEMLAKKEKKGHRRFKKRKEALMIKPADAVHSNKYST